MNKKSAIAVLGALLPLCSQAYDLPGMNLGSTSFYDGLPPPTGPGAYLVEYLQFGKASSFKDGNGDTLFKQDLETFVPTTQLLYLTDKKFLGGNIGYTAMVPYLAKADMDGSNSNTGAGDLMLGAMLQFDPIVGEGGLVYSHRLEFDVSFPTGDYDASTTINPSSNSIVINPYYTFTYWLNPRWTATSRISYMWNGKNDDPSGYQFLGAKETQAGQAVHVNFASAYKVSDQFSVGVAGYALQQLTNTKVNGKSVSGTKEKVWAIGPGMLYAFSPDDSIVANFYFEQGVENRAKSDRFVLRYNHHF